MDRRVVTFGGRNVGGGKLEVLTELASFGSGVADLKREGVGLITAEQLAIVIMADGFGGPFSSIGRPFNSEGMWIAENHNYGIGRAAEILLATGDYNPILKHPEEAAIAHTVIPPGERKEFYPGAASWMGLRERAESDPYKAMKSGVLLVTRKGLKPEIPVDALGETPETIFLFRKQAEAYGQWLKEQGIESIEQIVVSAAYARKQKQPFSRTLQFNGIQFKPEFSRLFGYDLDGDFNSCCGYVGGVREVPAEQFVIPTLDQVLDVASKHIPKQRIAALRQGLEVLYQPAK